MVYIYLMNWGATAYLYAAKTHGCRSGLAAQGCSE